MKPIKQLIAAATVAFATSVHRRPGPGRNEAPDVLVKRISTDVIDTAKADKDIQAGNQQQDHGPGRTPRSCPTSTSERMTALAAGRFWRQATPEQQKQLSDEFRTLLVYTYSGALSQIKNETVEFKPMRADPADTEVEVRSQVNVDPRRADHAELPPDQDARTAGRSTTSTCSARGWSRPTRAPSPSEISKGGIDGLIKTLAERNKQLANKPLKAPPK